MSGDPEMETSQSVELNDYLTDGRLTYKGWRRALVDDVLLGQSCDDCGHLTAAPKAACVRCGSESLAVRRLPASGVVYTETRVNVAPEAFDGPYQVALVSLRDEEGQGGRILAQIDGAVDIGDAVELVGVVESDDIPGPLFGNSTSK